MSKEQPAEVRRCRYCAKPLERRRTKKYSMDKGYTLEPPSRWKKRVFCDAACFHRFRSGSFIMVPKHS